MPSSAFVNYGVFSQVPCLLHVALAVVGVAVLGFSLVYVNLDTSFSTPLPATWMLDVIHFCMQLKKLENKLFKTTLI